MIEVVQGNGPLVLGLPHTGTYVPPEIVARLNATGRALADTDWHIERLYDGLVGEVTTVRTRAHRYVIDVNRAPGGESLYPGQNTTGLIPLTDFEGAPIWRDGDAPDAAEVEARREAYHAPYHAALAEELERVRARHGFAILYDCHSIRSRIPYLFDGVLPDLNIGTNGGTTCAPGIAATVQDACAASGYSTITDGRFKGGWTTRHYGRPDEGLHAIQMELSQATYLAAEASPWTYDAARAERLRATLRPILETLSAWRP
jgi:formiminoglutamase